MHPGKHPLSPQVIWTPSCSHRLSGFSVGFKLRIGVRTALGTCCPRRERRWGGDPQTRTCRAGPAPPRLAALPEVREGSAAETWPLGRAPSPPRTPSHAKTRFPFLWPLPSGGRERNIFRSRYRNNCWTCHACTHIVGGTGFLSPLQGSRPIAWLSFQAKRAGLGVMSLPGPGRRVPACSAPSGLALGQGRVCSAPSHPSPIPHLPQPCGRRQGCPQVVSCSPLRPWESRLPTPNIWTQPSERVASSARSGHYNLIIKLGARGKRHN